MEISRSEIQETVFAAVGIGVSDFTIITSDVGDTVISACGVRSTAPWSLISGNLK